MKILLAFISLIIVGGTAVAQSWRKVDGPMTTSSVWVTGFAQSGSTLFMATQSGILKSTDEGDTWEPTEHWGFNVSCIYCAADLRVYCGDGDAGLWRTSDKGVHWLKLYDNLDTTRRTYAISSILVDGSGTIYLAETYPSGGGDILKSIDDGATWQLMKRVGPYGAVNSLWKTANGSLLAGTQDGLCRSADEGNSWSNCAYNNGSGDAVWCFIVHNGRIYSGHDGGVIYSDDDGISWHNTKCTAGILCMTVDHLGNICAGSGGAGYWLSADNGDNWTESISGIPFDFEYPQSIFVNALGSLSSGRLILGTRTDVCISSNGGSTWILRHVSLSSPIGCLLLLQSAGVIAPSSNGTGGARSTDGGLHWDTAGIYVPDASCSDVNDSGQLYLGKVNPLSYYQTGNGLNKSTDDGKTWSKSDEGIQSAMYSPGIVSIAAGPGNSMVVSTSCVGVDHSNPHGTTYFNVLEAYRSTDRGFTWSKTSLGGGYILGRIGPLVFACGYFPGLLISRDSGLTWTSVLANKDSTSFNNIYGRDTSNIFAATRDSRVLHSSDGGHAWESRSNGLPRDNVTCFFEDSSLGCLCGTSRNGIYHTTNSGLTWEPLNTGIENRTISDIKRVSGGPIVAATERGLFILEGKNSVTQEHQRFNVAPDLQAFVLVEDHTASLSYVLPNRSLVVTALRDVLGRTVAQSRSSQTLNAGPQHTTFSLGGFPSGAYYAEVSAGPLFSTKAFLFVR